MSSGGGDSDLNLRFFNFFPGAVAPLDDFLKLRINWECQFRMEKLLNFSITTLNNKAFKHRFFHVYALILSTDAEI